MAKFIKYIGPAHRRIITADDWKTAGFPGENPVTWDWENGFSVPSDAVSDKAFDSVIKTDPQFMVMGGDEFAPRRMPKQTGEMALGFGDRVHTIGANLGGQVTPSDAPGTVNAASVNNTPNA